MTDMTDFFILVCGVFVFIIAIGVCGDAQKSKVRKPKRRGVNLGSAVQSSEPLVDDDIPVHGLTNSLITTTGDDLNPEMLADSSSSDINIGGLEMD